MAIKARDRDGICWVDITGNVRIGKEDIEMRERFKALIDEGNRRFVFDMTGVGFIDSAGIAETVACYKRAKEVGGVIKLVFAPSGKPAEVFQITSLDRVFEIYHGEDEALASFGE